MKTRILSFLLASLMLFGTLSVTASAIVAQNPVHKESGTVEAKADEFPAIRDGLSDYLAIDTQTMEDDGYIGIPVDITVYNNPEVFSEPSSLDTLTDFFETTEPNPVKLSATGKPLILYVINTNTTRYGTDSDVDIITELLAEGYVVMVVDYKNEKRAQTPDLDWSLQLVRTKYADYTGEIEIWSGYNYVLPAGYSIKRGVQFFNYQTSGVDGILDYITEIWNIDLTRTSGSYAKGNTKVIWGQKELLDGTKVYQDADGNRCIPEGDGYVYYTQNADYSYEKGEAVADPTTVTPLYKKVSDDAVWANEETREIKVCYTIAEDFWDCVKTNGDRIDLNLYSDICYPTNPEEDVPVMMLASSSELRSKATQTATRPISTGFMFTGYAFVNYDHAYTPMARTDHFGYFEGETDTRRTTFTLRYHTGIEAQTAAVRQVRALVDMYPDLFHFNVDAIGAWGHSKGATVNLLGTAHPELQPNEAFLAGHSGECSGTQQWLTYTDGTPIPSNVQLVYTSNGGGTHYVYEDNVPTVVTQGEQDGNFTNDTHYTVILNALRSLNVPALDMSMEGVGHTTVYGYNEDRDYDMYQALFDFTDYYLYGRASVCEYILPIHGTRGVDVKDDIIIKFTGPIPESEIKEKVKVVNATTGESVEGIWESAFAGNEWTFKPMGLEGGTVYSVLVPETLVAENGKAIKSRKSVSFRTAYDTAFTAAEVVSTNNSFTLTKSESADNGIYFVFNPLNATYNFETVLRFSVTNKAATTLAVYGVTNYNENGIFSSTHTDAPLATVGVADNEIVEVDVSEYVASLGVGEYAVFYVEAAKSEATTTLFESNFDEEDSRGPFASSTFEISPNGTPAIRQKIGSSGNWTEAITTKLTESDYGRLITVTFDALSTIDRPMHARMILSSNKVQDDGEYYVDYYNDATTLAYLKANEWRTITLTYRIDDYDYVKDSIQKLKLQVVTAANVISTEFLYLDNFKITETVIDATVASEQSECSIAPTLAIKNADQNPTEIVGGGYVASGKDADKSFDGENGYLVSGCESGMTESEIRVAYLKVNLSELSLTKPYALTIHTTSGTGAIVAYAIDPSAIPDDFDISKLNYLNAPALDRVSGTIKADAILGGVALGSVTVRGENDYQIGVTRALLDLKAKGAEYALIALVADSEATDGVISFTMKEGSSPIETTINLLDFDADEAFVVATRRGENTYDSTDIHMQGNYTVQESYASDGITPDSTIYYGDSGQSMKIIVPSGSYNVYKFIKLIDFEETPCFTSADIGKTFHISLKLYVTKEATGAPYAALACVGANTTSDGSASSKLVQKQSLSGLKVGEWNHIDYSFTVTEAMTGARASELQNDQRPVNFCLQGFNNNEIYVDELRFYTVANTDEETLKTPTRTENTFDSVADANKVGSNGFETYTDESGTKCYRVSYSTDDNFTEGGSGSLRVLHNKSYNRMFVTDLMDAANMTSENIGDTYTVVFRVKSDRAGTVLFDVGRKAHNTNTISGYPERENCVITSEDVGKWLTFSYTFTLTQAIVDDLASDTELFGFRVRFSGFGATSQGDVVTTLYFDDMICYRNAPEDGGAVLPVESSKVSSSTTLTTNDASVGASSTVPGIHKAYFKYDVSSVKDIHRAYLSIVANEYQGQTLKLYALPDVLFPELLTYENAPANDRGTDMLLEEVFGGCAIASFTLDSEGKAKIDVTDYIRTVLGESATFTITTKDGSIKYLGLDFAIADINCENDLTSDGVLAITDGALAVSGTSVTVKNAFGEGETTLPALAPVTVVAKVSADSEKTYTLTVDGTSYTISAAPSNGTVSFTFVPSEDIKASTVTVSASSQGFTLSSLEIFSACVANLKAPTLELYTPKVPEYSFDGVIASHNILISNSLSYNLYLAKDKGISSVSFGGVTYDFDALDDFEIDGVSHKLFVIDTAAKDAFVSNNVTITLQNGEYAVYEICIRRYLEQLYLVARDDAERNLASGMISYLAASGAYFYEDAVHGVAALAVRDCILGKNYDDTHQSTTLQNATLVKITEDSGMKGAGMRLGERPTFYFIAKAEYRDVAPTFTINGEIVRYEKEVIDGEVHFVLKHSPDVLAQNVTWTIGDASGSFNLSAYYEYAKEDAKDERLTNLIERLYFYVEAINTYFAE